MDDYFDRLMEKIPGANVAEKKVWFSFIFFCFWSEKSSQKIGMDLSLCAGEIQQLHRPPISVTEFGHSKYQTM